MRKRNKLGQFIKEGKLLHSECIICKNKFNYYFSSRNVAKYCSRKCSAKNNTPAGWNKGLKRWWNSPTEFKKDQAPWNKNQICLYLRGDNNYNWKGGITPIKNSIKKSLEYRRWRQTIFTRDNYTCVKCNYKSNTTINGKSDIQADHIKPFAFFPELRLDTNNGRTLCINCHRNTDTWGARIYKSVES